MVWEQTAQLVRGVASAVLLTSAVVKFVDPSNFTNHLQANPITRPSAAFLSRVVPVLELATGVLLLSAYARLGTIASILAGALFALLAAVGAYSPHVDCGCGPLVPGRRSWRTVMNVALAVLLLSTFRHPPGGAGIQALVALSGVALVLTIRLAGYWRLDRRSVERVISLARTDQLDRDGSSGHPPLASASRPS